MSSFQFYDTKQPEKLHKKDDLFPVSFLISPYMEQQQIIITTS